MHWWSHKDITQNRLPSLFPGCGKHQDWWNLDLLLWRTQISPSIPAPAATAADTYCGPTVGRGHLSGTPCPYWETFLGDPEPLFSISHAHSSHISPVFRPCIPVLLNSVLYTPGQWLANSLASSSESRRKAPFLLFLGVIFNSDALETSMWHEPVPIGITTSKTFQGRDRALAPLSTAWPLALSKPCPLWPSLQSPVWLPPSPCSCLAQLFSTSHL